MPGINARYDRMIHTLKLTQERRKPVESRSSLGRRHRRSSSSSSSGEPSSDTLLRTPIDPYMGLDDGRIGQDFAVLKMLDRKKRMKIHSWEHIDEDRDSIATFKNQVCSRRKGD